MEKPKWFKAFSAKLFPTETFLFWQSWNNKHTHTDFEVIFSIKLSEIQHGLSDQWIIKQSRNMEESVTCPFQFKINYFSTILFCTSFNSFVLQSRIKSYFKSSQLAGKLLTLTLQLAPNHRNYYKDWYKSSIFFFN